MLGQKNEYIKYMGPLSFSKVSPGMDSNTGSLAMHGKGRKGHQSVGAHAQCRTSAPSQDNTHQRVCTGSYLLCMQCTLFHQDPVAVHLLVRREEVTAICP